MPVTLAGVGLNPMELNDLYDHLWNIMYEDALSVLHEDYRPWPRVRYTEAPSRHYYDHPVWPGWSHVTWTDNGQVPEGNRWHLSKRVSSRLAT